MSYSSDFRRCVVENIQSGMSWDEASRIFKVSRDSVGRWLRQFRETGCVSDAPRRPYKKRKVDIEKLLELVGRHEDATLEELAAPFDVYPSTIDYHLRKMKITRKKNHAISGARRRKKTNVSCRD